MNSLEEIPLVPRTAYKFHQNRGFSDIRQCSKFWPDMKIKLQLTESEGVNFVFGFQHQHVQPNAEVGGDHMHEAELGYCSVFVDSNLMEIKKAFNT